jgi:hypothetical protein
MTRRRKRRRPRPAEESPEAHELYDPDDLAPGFAVLDDTYTEGVYDRIRERIEREFPELRRPRR